MSVRRLATTTVLAGGFALAVPAAAHASTLPVAAQTGMTSGRLGPTLVALVSLIAMAIGGAALARPTGRFGNGGRGALVALGLGLISVVVGGVLAATADGGPGTGNGIVASFAAVVFGLVSIVLGGLALSRARRAV